MEECRTCSRSLFFSLPLIFILHWWPLAFLIILSPPLQNFHVVFPTEKCLVCFFISRSRSLSPFFSLSFAGLPPTFSCSIFQMTIYLSLIIETTGIQKQFPLSFFVCIDSLVVSALQDAGGYAIFPPK